MLCPLTSPAYMGWTSITLVLDMLHNCTIAAHMLEHRSQVQTLTEILRPHQGKQTRWLVTKDICNNLIDFTECNKAIGQAADMFVYSLCVCLLCWFCTDGNCQLPTPAHTGLPVPCQETLLFPHPALFSCLHGMLQTGSSAECLLAYEVSTEDTDFHKISLGWTNSAQHLSYFSSKGNSGI